ncbi:hypothetical protein FC15_GL001660 [Lapidilactobacillus concavus DSM 17758]|uniref:Uncharacterized protein n=1 Tax=Lapidilactobacillus concavus DSM 17758 TaxID=1423735 RepID=A0A0R1VUX4_9LACO|nr:hypothetical protein [Lapidilactobacillus concavus]KRM09447.1 hypothetical protein FC15_GL001660 [Lapidilactobacillus concavus DSM 17758]GEL13807.1 hypothetical protein LCO01nite_13560 [Lapidilactobacillus concavus]
MGQNKIVNLIFVFWWAVTLYLVAMNRNMLAMYAMAIGMLVEEVLPLFRRHHHDHAAH